MAASSSTTTDSTPSEDTSGLRMTKYQVGELWLGLLDQDSYWVPRGAWYDYAVASASMINGRCYSVRPNFDIPGALAVVGMEVSHRRNVANFMWRRSVDICNRLSMGPLLGSGFSGDDWEGDFDEWDRYIELVRDEDARRAWFEAKPLVVKLRSSIVEERAARFSGPVLLDAPKLPEPSGRSVILLDRPAPPARSPQAAPVKPAELVVPSAKDDMREPARLTVEELRELDLSKDSDLCIAMGWEYLGQSRPTSPPYWRGDDGTSVANTDYDMPDAEDLLRWLASNVGECETGFDRGSWYVAVAHYCPETGSTLREAARANVVAFLEARIAADDDDRDDADSCGNCGGYHGSEYDCSADGY